MRPETGLRAAVMAAIVVVLISGVGLSQEARTPPKTIDFSKSEVLLDSYAFQSAITSGGGLGALAKEYPAVGQEMISFGFASASPEAKFFIIGSLYSEALAYLRSGDLKMAAARLQSIETEAVNLGVTSSLYNLISKLKNHVEGGAYSAETLGDFVSVFQPFFEDFARAQSEDFLILFRAGTWLVDMSLTAAAGNKNLLFQPAAIGYFYREMKRMDAPKGVLQAFEEITRITGKKDLTDADVKEVLNQVRKIQSILA